MSLEEPERDIRLVELLDQALTEFRAGRAVDTTTWKARHSDLPPDLPELLDTLRALDTAAEAWKVAPTLLASPTCAPGEPGPQPADPLPTKIGRYIVLELLGAGGMGSVYKAHDPELDRIVAVKVPHLHGPAPDRAVRKTRFLREARAAATVRHPHVCPIHDVGEDGGLPFVVMSFVEGESLAQRLRRAGRYDDPRQAVALVRQVADALASVHAHGIIHRDLKPANILLDPAGGALLSDFGLARSDRAPDQLTVEGDLLGTPAYMAPEQATGQLDRIGPWTDLYSLGVVLYQALTGRLPFDGPTTLSVLHRIANEPPPPPSQFRPDLAPALEAIVQKAMARRPEDRYQNPQQLAEALDYFSEGATPTCSALPAVGAAPTSATAGLKTVELAGLPDGQVLKLSLPAGTKADVQVTMTEGKRRKGRDRRWRVTVNIAVAVAVLLTAAAGLHLALNRVAPEGGAILVSAKKAESPDQPPMKLQPARGEIKLVSIEPKEVELMAAAQVQQYAYNTAVLGGAYPQVPTWTSGYAPSSPTSLLAVLEQPTGSTYPPARPSPYANPYLTGELGSLYLATYARPAVSPYTIVMSGGTGQPNHAQPTIQPDQARLLRAMALEAKREVQAKGFRFLEQYQQKNPYLPGQQLNMQNMLQRIQATNNLSDTLSGKTLNQLLTRLKKQLAGKASAVSAKLPEQVLKHLNLATKSGNVALLRDAARFTWPAALLDLTKEEQRLVIETDARRLSAQAATGRIDKEGCSGLEKQLASLNDELVKKVNDLTVAEYLASKRFLNNFKAALTGLQEGDVVLVRGFRENFAPGGKTAGELVAYLLRNDLHFAPALVGDEAAYQAVQAALSHYSAALERQGEKK